MKTLYICSYPGCSYSCRDKDELLQHEKQHGEVCYKVSIIRCTGKAYLFAYPISQCGPKEPQFNDDTSEAFCFTTSYEDISNCYQKTKKFLMNAVYERYKKMFLEFIESLNENDIDKLIKNIGKLGE